MPEQAAGIISEKQSVDSDTALLSAGPVSVRIRGFWASNGGQNLYVTYTNNGAAPVRIAMDDWSLSHQRGRAALYQVLDTTGMATANATVPSDDQRRLYDVERTDASKALLVPAGASRSLSVGFARFQPDGTEPKDAPRARWVRATGDRPPCRRLSVSVPSLVQERSCPTS